MSKLDAELDAEIERTERRLTLLRSVKVELGAWDPPKPPAKKTRPRPAKRIAAEATRAVVVPDDQPLAAAVLAEPAIAGLLKTTDPVFALPPKCGKCGETEPMKFYPSNRWRCKTCTPPSRRPKREAPEKKEAATRPRMPPPAAPSERMVAIRERAGLVVKRGRDPFAIDAGPKDEDEDEGT